MRFLSGVPARVALIALLVLSPSALLAKPRDVSCKALADRLLAERKTPETKVIEDGKGCVVTNLKIEMGRYRVWTVDRLTVSGPDFRRLEKGKPFPSALHVEAHGIRFAPDIGDSHSRYLVQVQQRPFDARLSYDWDKATQQLHLRELAMDSPLGGLIALSMDADLSDLDKRTTAPGLKDFGIRRVSMVLDNHGLFEGMLLPPLIALVPAEKDPAVEVPKAKTGELARIRALPASMIDTASRSALSRFVSDFPHPKGRLEIDQTFDKPLQVGDLQAVLAAGTSTWLQGSRLQVRYDLATSRYRSPVADAQTPQSGAGW